MAQQDFSGYVAGNDIDGWLANFTTRQEAARDMLDYVTGEAADETDLYDPDAARNMRETKYSDVAAWVNRIWSR